jgi:hypothetical protein
MLVNGREALMPLVRLDSYGPLIGVWKDMLAAYPVVPVGVSREDMAFLISDSVFADDATEFTGVLRGIYEAADAILAALTGEDTATLGLFGKTQTDARTRGDG